jgi:hypothetical protein
MLSPGSFSLVADDAERKKCIQNQDTCNNSKAAEESGKLNTQIDDQITTRVDAKLCICCGSQTEDQALICESCGPAQNELLKAHYKPNWWEVIVGFLVVASSLVTLSGILFAMVYVFELP